MKNLGSLLVFRTKKEVDEISADKGVFARLGKMHEKISNGFQSLAQKAMDHADKIRATKVRESVKDALDTLKGIPGGLTRSEPSRDR